MPTRNVLRQTGSTLIVVFFNLACVLSAFGFSHPGLLHTSADFARMKTKVAAGAQPWKSGWDVLVANSHSSPNYRMQGPVATVYRGTGSPENYSKLYNDIAAAYANALRWKIAGDTGCADRAVAIMNAWSSTLTAIDGTSDRFLAAGLYGYEFANAAELLRGYSGWADADFARFQQMMLTVFYPMNHDFLVRHNGACISHYWANWDLCNMASILAIGVLCDDPVKYSEAIDYFKHGAGNGQIGHLVPFLYPGNLGQCQESGRDQGHSCLDVSLIGAICQMAYNQGDDLFAYDNNRVLAMCEYVAQYNLGNSVPYTTYDNCDHVNQTVVSPGGRGDTRPSWELIFNHYARVAGIRAPQSQAYAALVRPEGGGGNYGPNSGGYDQLGYGTLTFTLDPPSPPARLSNLSVRSFAGSGAQSLIAGFVVAGGMKPFLVRCAGPALASFGVVGAVAAPQLALYSSASRGVLAHNAGWDSTSSAAAIQQAAHDVGAFAFSAGSGDSALLATLGDGAYSAQVGGVGSEGGTALVEVYDADPGGTGRLVNLSARTQVGTGDNVLIAGFVIAGTDPKTLLIRAVGPSLASFGVTGLLADPQLTIRDQSTGAIAASNSGWSTSSPTQLAGAAMKAGAFALSAASADSAVVLPLGPGAYTAQVSGATGDSGVALVEIYEVE